MAGYLSGDCRIDIVGPSSIVAAAATATSNYVDMSRYKKVMFVVSCGTMDSSGAIALAMQAARSSTGSGAIAIGVNATMNAEAAAGGLTITKAAEVFITGSSDAGFADGQAYVINGITYTAESTVGTTGMSTGYFTSARIFCGGTGADGSSEPNRSLHHLAAYINHPQYGVPGVFAIVTGVTSSLTLYANNSAYGESAITVTVPITSQAHYIKKMVGSVEALADILSTSSGFNYVAVTATPAGSAVSLSGVAIRSGARFSPDTTALMTYEYGTT